MSDAGMTHTATCDAHAITASKSSSRRASVWRLESSSMPSGAHRAPRSLSTSRHTAAATSGPASAPRPASSAPATRRAPRSRSWARRRRPGRRRVRRATVTAMGSPYSDARTRGMSQGWAGTVPVSARLLAHPRGLADLAAEVVQLGAVDVADRDDVDLLDLRRVDRERPFHSDAERLLAHRERLADARTLALDADALEDLHPLPLPLDDLEVHTERVARLELGQLAQLALFNVLDDCHGMRNRRKSRRMLPDPGRASQMRTGPPVRLLLAPARHLAVVARQQHRRHRPPAKLLRAGVVRILRATAERLREGVLEVALVSPEGAGQLARDGVEHSHRSHLTAREHVRPDRDGVVREVVVDPLVEPLVAPAQKRQALEAGELGHDLVAQLPPHGREHRDAPLGEHPLDRRPVEALERGADDVDPDHHPGAA